MRHALFASLAVALLSQPASAALIQPADLFVFEFSDLTYVGENSEDMGALALSLAFGRNVNYDLTTGETWVSPSGLLNFDLFEDQASASPFHSVRDMETTGLGGANFLFYDANLLSGPELVPWSDREGRMVLWVSGGDVELTGVRVLLRAGGNEYHEYYSLAAVPLPATFWLLGSGLLLIVRNARTRSRCG